MFQKIDEKLNKNSGIKSKLTLSLQLILLVIFKFNIEQHNLCECYKVRFIKFILKAPKFELLLIKLI